MTHGTPTWRVDKDRERIESECEERAREEGGAIPDVGALIDLLGDLETEEVTDINLRVSRLFERPNEATANSLIFGLKRCAYRRALAVERRSAGLT